MQNEETLRTKPLAKDCDFDVLVIGGGIVGATLACALGNTAFSVGILDSQAMPGLDSIADSAESVAGNAAEKFDPRVSAISPASRRIFSNIGVWQMLEQQRHCPYADMHVWEADGTGSIHFAAADVRAEALGYIVENSITLACLHERIQQFENVKSITPATVTAIDRVPVSSSDISQVVVTLADGSQLTTRLLVAADGANSKIRELAHFATKEWDYEHHAIVTTVRTQLPHDNTAIQRFMDTGILAFLPLALRVPNKHSEDAVQDAHYCSIVWSVIPEKAQQLLAMSDTEFSLALQASIESRLGAVEWVDKRFSFPLRQRHANNYVSGNIALIGDAAHSIHPLAGQGANLGILDAWSLAGQLLKAKEQHLDFASLRVLQRYQRERKGHNLGMMWLMEGFKRLFADQPLPVRWLRNAGMSSLDSLPMLKNRIMRQAMGTDTSLD